jgi:hypothetical protein
MGLAEALNVSAADLNGDCRMDFADPAIQVSEWLASGNPPHSPSNPTKSPKKVCENRTL